MLKSQKKRTKIVKKRSDSEHFAIFFLKKILYNENMANLATSSTSTLETSNRIDLITSVEKQYNPDGSPVGYSHYTYSVPVFTFFTLALISLIVFIVIIKFYFFNHYGRN